MDMASKSMEAGGGDWKIPLAQVEEIDELKARYSIYSDEVLIRWVNAVTGSHRNAIASILKERGQMP